MDSIAATAGDTSDTALAAWVSAEPCPPAAAEPSPVPTQLIYEGQLSAECGTPLTAQARLTSENGEPLGGRSLRFQAGLTTAFATTDDAGLASVTLPPTFAGALTELQISFDGGPSHLSSSTSALLQSTARDVSLTYAGPDTLLLGEPTTVSAALHDAVTGAPLAAQDLVFTTFGTDATATTDERGVASATITGAADIHPALIRS